MSHLSCQVKFHYGKCYWKHMPIFCQIMAISIQLSVIQFNQLQNRKRAFIDYIIIFLIKKCQLFNPNLITLLISIHWWSHFWHSILKSAVNRTMMLKSWFVLESPIWFANPNRASLLHSNSWMLPIHWPSSLQHFLGCLIKKKKKTITQMKERVTADS